MEQKHSILLVEDDASWQMIYQEILSDEGYTVDIAKSKTQASGKLGQHAFDVAIIDLRLDDEDPKNMDGIEVIRLLRERNVPTRIIVKSGYLTGEVMKTLGELDVDGILDKESEKEELVRLVKEAMIHGAGLRPQG